MSENVDELREMGPTATDGPDSSLGIEPLVEQELEPGTQSMLEVDDNDEEEDPDLKAALALSLQEDASSNPISTNVNSSVCEVDFIHTERDMEMQAFHKVMWDSSASGGGGTTQEDQSRWISQAVLFSSIASDHNLNSTGGESKESESQKQQLKWGLVQNHGGPCGVLAAIQAEVLKILLFESPTSSDPKVVESNTSQKASIEDLGGDEESMNVCLALAMARILARAAVMQSSESQPSTNTELPSVTIVIPYYANAKSPPIPTNSGTSSSKTGTVDITNYEGLEWGALDPWPWGSAGSELDMKCKSHVLTLSKYHIQNSNTSVEEQLTQATFQFLKDRLYYFNVTGGVLLFVMSLVETRRADIIQSGKYLGNSLDI